MPLAKYLWGAVTGMVNTVGGFEDPGIPDVMNPEPIPTNSHSSADLQHARQQGHSQDSEQVRAAARIEPQPSVATQPPEGKDANAGEVTISGDSDLQLNHNTHENDEHQHESQKEAAEQAAAAAESHTTEMPTTRIEDMSVADSEIKDLCATHIFTLGNSTKATELRQNLSRTEKQIADKVAVKAHELQRLQTNIDGKDSEVCRLKAKAEADREAKEKFTREKNRLYREKLVAERDVEKLQVENEHLKSEKEHLRSGKEEAESRVLRAEGCANGMQAQLMATKTREQQWRIMYTKAEENARDKVLSAYDVAETQVPEEGQQTIITTLSKEEELAALVESLRKENGQLQEAKDRMTTENQERDRVWEKTIKDHGVWKQEMDRWYKKEKQEALAEERVKGRLINVQDAREQEIRRQCDEEKQRALAVERDKCRVQWKSLERSQRGQYAVKLRSHNNQELQKLRRKVGTEHKQQTKVKKSQLKWEFKRAVSHAVEVERSLFHTQLQIQFQAELTAYKTHLESEHTKSQTQPASENDIGAANQALLQEEIKKRDGQIEKHKEDLKKALNAKRESESGLESVKKENDRLSQAVIAYESEKSVAKHTTSEAQVTLVTQELVRALKLLMEIATLGIDEKHRGLLNELVIANKVVRDIRTTIEEGVLVDYEAFQNRLDRVVASSDEFDNLDPMERPALHAQLEGTYSVIGGLLNIFAGERGDTTQHDLLERIYRDSIKGKGKQGAIIGAGAASGPSSAMNCGVGATPVPQPNGNNQSRSDPSSNNNITPTSTQSPSAHPSSTTSNPNAPTSQNSTEDIDPATAHALQENVDLNWGTSEHFDLDSIDWSDPAWLNIELP